ncbi:HU family DNA-binding protein [Tenggerimyces flavus]|uniref:HU family DNA-binding protein n=1 Tax=Tenggerimyces flavus TaxID=1708749 RepID=A0ABV7YBN4_9ACTN|nr:HU family DNA-binding protein [Tenggerimyces flavus]MBM7786642.1 DNA-binding protein HU-beta [Tenggerimyces flavus]
MNKSQLIDTLAGRFDGNKRDAQHALESVLDTITRAVAAGEKVSITGFGAFEKLDRPARMVRNPASGQRVRAKKTSVPKFRAGANLKAVVAGQKKLPKLTVAKAAATKAAPVKAAATKAAPAKAAATKAAKAPAKSPAKRAAVKATTAKKTATKATTTRATKKASPAKKTAKRAVKS